MSRDEREKTAEPKKSRGIRVNQGHGVDGVVEDVDEVVYL